jgi:hypothetical protein
MYPDFSRKLSVNMWNDGVCVLRFSGIWRIPWKRMSSWGNSLPARVVHFLTLDEAITIHECLIERFGGLKGVRGLGLLESALYRPRTGYYQDPTMGIYIAKTRF